MKTLLREPLLYFFVLGGVLFIAHGLVSENGAEPERIVIGQGEIDSMITGFSRTWQRPPNADELDGLIRDRVREEVYYRQAMAMGLDRDDTIIRRRLRQKLEFVTNDIAALAEPTDAELADYLAVHADDYRVGAAITFRQVYLSPQKRGDRLTQDASRLLAQLRLQGNDADASSLGDPFLLEQRLQSEPAAEIEKQFGAAFVASLREIPVGAWHGPVESAYGVHLVWVEERSEGHRPELAEVREAVSRDWANARRLESNERLFQEMLKGYTVTIERPAAAAPEEKLAKVR